MVEEIVTDNGSGIIKAVKHLSHKYGIHHIRISLYNSQANGIVEWRHRDVREVLMKLAEDMPKKWPLYAPSVFWAERVTILKSTGFSPYYIAHGIEPLLPFNLTEATYMSPPLDSELTTADVILYCAHQLQKSPKDLEHIQDMVLKSCLKSMEQFKIKYESHIKDYKFMKGALALVRNVVRDNRHDSKATPWYIGPMVVLQRTKGGAYIMAELDGSIAKTRYAAKRLVPYLPCKFVTPSSLVSA